MLAQSFKSAVDLDITDPERDALCTTLVLLETGRLRHASAEELEYCYRPRSKRKFSGEFNMAEWSAPHKCGTACCIGGTAELIGGVVFDERNNKSLQDLFYPPIVAPKYHDITPAQAATALRSYLTTGNANWHEAVQ